jgi:acid phosphatase (class A)
MPLNYAALLAPPPAPDSAVAREDAQALHIAERTRTPQQIQRAQADDHEESIFALTSVLGPNLDPTTLPLTAQLSLHLRAESGVVNPGLKTAFNRPRPYVADPTLHPVCDRATTNSYPSGHAMIGYLEAFALVQMIPERKEDILRRASEFAQNRIVCGVHYPTDIEASHTIALALFGTISTSPRFQQELAAARCELRRKLHLPPA